MTTDSPPQPLQAPRPTVGRGGKVRTAVLAATLAEIGEVGFAALTVENVAQRAGVHKTTIYRRWPDRESLMLDAVTDFTATETPIPDTGNFEEDCRILAHGLVALMNSPIARSVNAVMGAEAVRFPALADLRRRFNAERLRRAEPVVYRAIERGDLPPGIDVTEVLRAVSAPIHYRFQVSLEPVDEATADRAVRAAYVAAWAGVFDREDKPAGSAG